MIVIKLRDRYLVWSTIVDAPTTFGMTLDELYEYARIEEGASGVRRLTANMERIERTGTTFRTGASLQFALAGNHAGPDDAELSVDEIYQAYCLQVPIRDGWLVPVDEEA
jgi:hypothetical protein